MCGWKRLAAIAASRSNRRIVLHRGGEHLERILTRQSRMVGKIHLTHPAHTESPHDPIAGEPVADVQGACHRCRPGLTFMASMVSRLRSFRQGKCVGPRHRW